VGAAALAQHAVALFYTATVARYHFLAWFLTMLVVMVWLQQLGVVSMQRRYPALSDRFIANPLSRRLASWLARLQKVSA
jgi:heme/copper-type cytochrome/quinol oxidase subunit 1